MIGFYTVNAQPYESVFGKDTTQWNIVYLIPDDFPTLIYKAYGDTSINGQQYVPVYMGFYDYPLEFYGYLKEDTAAGKLWFRDLNDKEKLIMDLSLIKGDVFQFEPDHSMPFTVDSIYYNFGKKVISFEPEFSDPVLFTEGLGPSNMFYKEYVEYPDYAQIRCKHKDNILVFINDISGRCLDTLTSVSEYFNESFQIYPNPTHDYIKILTRPEDRGSIKLFNSKGNRVLFENINANQQLFIGYLPKGVYLVKFQIGNKQFTNKLLKQ